MALSAYFMAPWFSVRLFGFELTGQEWEWLGAVVGFLLTDKKLAGTSPPGADSWFFALPAGKEIHVSASEYAVALNQYSRLAKELAGWRKQSPQPETVNLQPLLTCVRSLSFSSVARLSRNTMGNKRTTDGCPIFLGDPSIPYIAQAPVVRKSSAKIALPHIENAVS
jgi:hypothetical protein